MYRLAVRIVGLAFCASALAGCGMMGMGGESSAVPPSQNAAETMPMGADLSEAIRQAQLLRSKGDLEGTTRILSQLMLAAPDDPRVVGEYGKLLVQQGRSGDAVNFLRRAVELQPGDWTLYSALGVAYDQQNDQPNAKLAYERGLQIKPGEPALLNNFAMSRMLAGDTTGARTLILQAQASGSTDPKIARNLALLDRMSPAAPATAVAMAPAHTPTANNGFPPLPARGAPIAHNALPPAGADAPRVVMQAVPVDPLAGPVGHHGKPATRTARSAKPGAARHVAANTPPKAAKPGKLAKTNKPAAHDHIPALRMTADAGKP